MQSGQETPWNDTDPTWAVLVFFKLNSDLAAVPLVIGGAVAAASGRFVLAHAARRLRGRFSQKRLESLAAAQEALAGDRRKELTGLALFAVSPVPSAQLFIAAGLLDVPLVRFTLAFFAGRLVSYSLMLVVDAPPRDAPTSGAARATSSSRARAVRARAREPPGRPRPGVRSFLPLLLVPRSVRSEWLSSRLPSRARSAGGAGAGSVTKGAFVNW